MKSSPEKSSTEKNTIRCRATVPDRSHQGFNSVWAAGQQWPTGSYEVHLTTSALEAVAAELRGVEGQPEEWLQIERLDTGERITISPKRKPVPEAQTFEEEQHLLARAAALKAKRANAAEIERKRRMAEASELARIQQAEIERKVQRERHQAQVEEARRLVAEEDGQEAQVADAEKQRAEKRGIFGLSWGRK